MCLEMKNSSLPKSNFNTLLIVEDESELRSLLAEELAEIPNVQILEAANGIIALEKLKTTPITAILSDINMPELNGLDFLEAARNLGFDTPLVFLTGYGDKEKAIRALRLGAFDFLSKPYDRQLLVETVSRALNFGQQIISIESELDKLFDQSGLPQNQKEKYKSSQRALLRMRADISALNTKYKKVA
jgi:DNA-binding NtrC family response regulator